MNRTLAQLQGSIDRPWLSDEWDSETCRVFFGAAVEHGFPVDDEHVQDNYSYAIEAAIALDAIPVVQHNGSMHNIGEYGGVKPPAFVPRTETLCGVTYVQWKRGGDFEAQPDCIDCGSTVHITGSSACRVANQDECGD